MYIHFLHLDGFNAHEGHAALMDAMICNNHHHVQDLLMEYFDHAELLTDVFLTPTLMWMVEESRPAMFRVWNELGYNMGTYLLDPSSQELTLPLLHWSTLALPIERLKELSREEKFEFNPWEWFALSPDSKVILPGVIFGILRGDPEHRHYWLETWLSQFQTEKSGYAHDAQKSIKVLIDGLVGLRKVPGEMDAEERWLQVFEKLEPVLFSNERVLKYQQALENHFRLEAPTLTAILSYWKDKDAALYAHQEDWSRSLDSVPAWNAAIQTGLPLSKEHLRAFLLSGLDHDTYWAEDGLWVEAWNGWVKANPGHPLLQGLPKLFKNKQGEPLSGRQLFKVLVDNSSSEEKEESLMGKIHLCTTLSQSDSKPKTPRL